MSGGALDYSYSKLNNIIDNIKSDIGTDVLKDVNLSMFIKHLSKVSDCLYKIEWWLSGDTDKKDAIDSIKELFGNSYKDKSIEYLKTEMDRLVKFYEELE